MKRLLILLLLSASSGIYAQGTGQYIFYDPATDKCGSLWMGVCNGKPLRLEIEDSLSYSLSEVDMMHSLNVAHVSAAPSAIVRVDDSGVLGRCSIADLANVLPAKEPDNSSISAGARSFNTAYQISPSGPAVISVSVEISVTPSSTSGQVYLEYSPDGSDWYLAAVHTLFFQGSFSEGSQMSCTLPAEYYWRLRTAGTANFLFLGGLETRY